MTATRARAQDPVVASHHNPQVVGKYQGRTESKLPRNRTSAPPPPADLSKNRSGSQSSDSGQWTVAVGVQENQSSADPPPLPSRAEVGIRAEAKKPSEEAMTPKSNLFFERPELNCPKAQKTEASTNPFASSEEGSHGGDIRAKCQEDALEGWSFQGRKKHMPKFASPKSDTRHPPPLEPRSKSQLQKGKERNSTSTYTPLTSPR